MDQKELLYTVGRVQLDIKTLENILALSSKVEDTHTICQEIPLLGIYPKETSCMYALGHIQACTQL